MFVALTLPDAVKDDLAEFLEPRQEAAPAMRWSGPDQWHLTLAFLADVTDRHTDELLERLERAASRRKPLVLRLAGAGAFPDAARAKVLWAGVEHDGEELMRLAGGVRAAGAKSGNEVGGGRFHPHLTLAGAERAVPARGSGDLRARPADGRLTCDSQQRADLR